MLRGNTNAVNGYIIAVWTVGFGFQWLLFLNSTHAVMFHKTT